MLAVFAATLWQARKAIRELWLTGSRAAASDSDALGLDDRVTHSGTNLNAVRPTNSTTNPYVTADDNRQIEDIDPVPPYSEEGTKVAVSPSAPTYS